MENSQTKFIPGPGNYENPFQTVARSAPKYGFGSEMRNDSQTKAKAYVPGPGTYD